MTGSHRVRRAVNYYPDDPDDDDGNANDDGVSDVDDDVSEASGLEDVEEEDDDDHGDEDDVSINQETDREIGNETVRETTRRRHSTVLAQIRGGLVGVHVLQGAVTSSGNVGRIIRTSTVGEAVQQYANQQRGSLDEDSDGTNHNQDTSNDHLIEYLRRTHLCFAGMSKNDARKMCKAISTNWKNEICPEHNENNIERKRRPINLTTNRLSDDKILMEYNNLHIFLVLRDVYIREQDADLVTNPSKAAKCRDLLMELDIFKVDTRQRSYKSYQKSLLSTLIIYLNVHPFHRVHPKSQTNWRKHFTMVDTWEQIVSLARANQAEDDPIYFPTQKHLMSDRTDGTKAWFHDIIPEGVMDLWSAFEKQFGEKLKQEDFNLTIKYVLDKYNIHVRKKDISNLAKSKHINEQNVYTEKNYVNRFLLMIGVDFASCPDNNNNIMPFTSFEEEVNASLLNDHRSARTAVLEVAKDQKKMYEWIIERRLFVLHLQLCKESGLHNRFNSDEKLTIEQVIEEHIDSEPPMPSSTWVKHEFIRRYAERRENELQLDVCEDSNCTQCSLSFPLALDYNHIIEQRNVTQHSSARPKLNTGNTIQPSEYTKLQFEEYRDELVVTCTNFHSVDINIQQLQQQISDKSGISPNIMTHESGVQGNIKSIQQRKHIQQLKNKIGTCIISGKTFANGRYTDMHHVSDQKDIIIIDSEKSKKLILTTAKEFKISSLPNKNLDNDNFVEELTTEVVKVIPTLRSVHRIITCCIQFIPESVIKQMDLNFVIKKQQYKHPVTGKMLNQECYVYRKPIETFNEAVRMYVHSNDPWSIPLPITNVDSIMEIENDDMAIDNNDETMDTSTDAGNKLTLDTTMDNNIDDDNTDIVDTDVNMPQVESSDDNNEGYKFEGKPLLYYRSLSHKARELSNSISKQFFQQHCVDMKDFKKLEKFHHILMNLYFHACHKKEFDIVEEFDRDLLDKELMLENIGPEIINQDNGICNGYRSPRREMINFN